jgi:hypothetical protein
LLLSLFAISAKPESTVVKNSNELAIDSRIKYFIRGAPRQNFGDYLPEIVFTHLLTYPKIDADIFRLVGSVIDDRWARSDLRQANGHLNGILAYWCCGARQSEPLRRSTKRHCRFFGVRGPLTRDALNLPPDTVLGDPGLLAPLFHVPREHAATMGRTICIPHIHEPKSHDELLRLSGAELILSPEIDASEDALRDILDKIASAEFVLTGSLHGAIIACAYKRPFAFWDSGHVDIPFKWEDFAGSINIPATFAKDLEEGRGIYRGFADAIKLPPLAPILDVCPFVAKPAAIVRAMAYDGSGNLDALTSAAESLEGLTSSSPTEVYHLQNVSEKNRHRRKRLRTFFRRKVGLLIRYAKSQIMNLQPRLVARSTPG